MCSAVKRGASTVWQSSSVGGHSPVGVATRSLMGCGHGGLGYPLGPLEGRGHSAVAGVMRCTRGRGTPEAVWSGLGLNLGLQLQTPRGAHPENQGPVRTNKWGWGGGRALERSVGKGVLWVGGGRTWRGTWQSGLVRGYWSHSFAVQYGRVYGE